MISRQTGWHAAALGVEMGMAGLIALLLLVLAWAHNVRLDLTPTQEHTLSDQARRTARRLSRDVTFTVFFNSQNQGRVREMKDLLRKFQEQSSHVQFRMYDLDRSPLLANRYGIVNYDSAVLEGYDRAVTIRQLDESLITTKLIELIEGREQVALFTTGHGELDPGDPDERRGLSQVAKGLEAENYRIERTTDLRSGIADGTALLVMAGPTTDFTESEIQVVQQYIDRGGGALALLEANAPATVQALVRGYGIVPGNDLVVDERNRLFFADSFAPQVAYFNEAVMPASGAPPAVLPLAQSVTVQQPPRDDVRNAPLAFTGDDAWADIDRRSVETERPVFRPGIDLAGPVPVAAIAHLEKGQKEGEGDRSGSLIVAGDASFASNLYAGSLGNKDLFLNLAHLAAREEALIAVRTPGQVGGTFSRIYLTAGQARVLFWSSAVALPGALLLIGALVGWRRRSRASG